tara:strand:- start:327 stop:467 length:141 start_codon:yes stop_codon:yes gene_type:complete
MTLVEVPAVFLIEVTPAFIGVLLGISTNWTSTNGEIVFLPLEFVQL